MKQPAVYIMASKRNGTLYTGVTSTLVQRVWQHREGLADGFTKRYGLKTLVYYEWHDDIRTAIQREKTIKHWPRAWKVRLNSRHESQLERLIRYAVLIGGIVFSIVDVLPLDSGKAWMAGTSPAMSASVSPLVSMVGVRAM